MASIDTTAMGDPVPAGVHEAMAKVMAAVSHIAKKRSQGVSYEFRGIDEVMNALHGPLADNGLFLSPRVLDDWRVEMIPGSPDNKGNPRQQTQAVFRVAVDVWHESGESVTLGPGLAQSHDYGDKSVYQAQQNAIKYLLLEAFAIPTAEQDMDAREADDVPVEPKEESEADRAMRFIKEEGAVFKEWTKTERNAAYKTAMEMLAYDKLSTMVEAQNIFEHMRNAYETR